LPDLTQAASGPSEVTAEGTVAQPDTKSSSASPATGQKQRISEVTVGVSSSGSPTSPSIIPKPNAHPKGVLMAENGLRIRLNVAHPKATGSAQKENEPRKKTSPVKPGDAHDTGHRRVKTVARGEVPEQERNVDQIQTRSNPSQNSQTDHPAAQAPSFVDNSDLSFANKETTHPAATSPSPLPLEGIPKYREGVRAAQRPSIRATPPSNTPAHEVFADRDSTQEAESQEETVAKLEKEEPPSTSAKLEDVKIDGEEIDEDVEEKSQDQYKSIDPAVIHQEFEKRREQHRMSRAKKERKRELRRANGQPSRGQHNYCSHRAVATKPREYRSTLRSLPCKCGVSHKIPDPREWKSSPAEDGWDYSLPKGGDPVRQPKKVTFAEPMVTKVREFAEWWEDEYGLSDQYHSRGPYLHKSKDPSTEADDDQEIQSMGNLAPELSRSLHRAASNATANTSDLANSPATRTLNTLTAMAAKQCRPRNAPNKVKKRQGDKQRTRSTNEKAWRRARACSTPHLVLMANLLPSSGSNVVRSAPKRQDNVDRGEEKTIVSSKSDSQFVGEAAGSPASTGYQSERLSPVTSTPSQQCADGVGDDYSSGAELRPLRAFRSWGDSRGLRSPGPQYGGRTRWSPYHLTGPRKRHSPQREESDEELLMDVIVNAALELELALQADEAREVPPMDELPINDAVANAALEQELALQADIEREVPTMEKLSVHVADGKAKIKEWWDSLEKAHASRAASAFSTRGPTRTEDSETAYYNDSDTSMPDAEEEFEMSEDLEMLDAEDNANHSRLPIALSVRSALPTSGFGARLVQSA